MRAQKGEETTLKHTLTTRQLFPVTYVQLTLQWIRLGTSGTLVRKISCVESDVVLQFARTSELFRTVGARILEFSGVSDQMLLHSTCTQKCLWRNCFSAIFSSPFIYRAQKCNDSPLATLFQVLQTHQKRCGLSAQSLNAPKHELLPYTIPPTHTCFCPTTQLVSRSPGVQPMMTTARGSPGSQTFAA